MYNSLCFKQCRSTMDTPITALAFQQIQQSLNSSVKVGCNITYTGTAQYHI